MCFDACSVLQRAPLFGLFSCKEAINEDDINLS